MAEGAGEPGGSQGAARDPLTLALTFDLGVEEEDGALEQQGEQGATARDEEHIPVTAMARLRAQPRARLRGMVRQSRLWSGPDSGRAAPWLRGMCQWLPAPLSS